MAKKVAHDPEEEGTRRLVVLLPAGMKHQLEALARKNLRTVTKEVWLAVRAHLAANGMAEDERPAGPS
jgi:hypothetical protein